MPWQAALPADQRKVAGRLEFKSSRRRSRLYDELAKIVQTLYTTYCYRLSTKKLYLKDNFLNVAYFVRFSFIDNKLDVN